MSCFLLLSREPGCGTKWRQKSALLLGGFRRTGGTTRLPTRWHATGASHSRGAIDEMIACNRTFYTMPRIIRKLAGDVRRARNPLFSLVSNLSSRRNSRLLAKAYAGFRREEGVRF